ncbi:MAG TPA: hypothetical protein DDY13_12630 [Cytophagales bacterium]|jgi:CubicO group peptidase (beta-lactamase class C family)|nr:hypothetical protein [Cytophagales bacterium]
MTNLYFLSICLAATYLLSGCSDHHNKGLKSGTYQEAALNKQQLQKLDSLFSHSIRNNTINGGVALVARNGVIAYHKAFGAKGLTDDEPMKKDHLFRIASMTKPLTAVAILQLWIKG